MGLLIYPSLFGVKKMKKTKKVFKLSLNVVFYSIIIVLILFSIANMKIKKENNIANIFGFGFLSVQSNSMYGNLDDSFEKGDMIFVNLLDETERQNLSVGDIITYYDMSIKTFNTHRIVEIKLEEDYLITQADYNQVSQSQNTSPDQPITLDQAIAVYDGHVANLGSTLDYVQSPSGFAVVVILPVVIMLLVEGFKLFKNIMALNKEKLESKYKDDLNRTHELLEIEKQKMREALIKELKQKEESI
jgi:signal peptidase